MSQQRLPIVLMRVAAVVFIVAPVIALVQGTVEYLGFTKVALIFVISWGLSRSALWARWLLVLLAAFAVWGAWSAWHLPESYGRSVPAFAVWRLGRLVGALLMATAAVLVLRSRLRRESLTS
jgi:4-amino-4-deoxy-L-arabinose transferase-like glycosyltransferase